MARTTQAHIVSAFSSFVHAAQEVGFDTTDWQLQCGNPSYGYQYRVISQSQGNITRDLGDTKGQAWEGLRNYSDAWYKIGEKLRK